MSKKKPKKKTAKKRTKQGASNSAPVDFLPSLQAMEDLLAALGENKHVPSYLLGRKKMPRTLPGHYGFGEDNEAVLYAHENRAAWKATPGALEWLAAKVK